MSLWRCPLPAVTALSELLIKPRRYTSQVPRYCTMVDIGVLFPLAAVHVTLASAFHSGASCAALNHPVDVGLGSASVSCPCPAGCPAFPR